MKRTKIGTAYYQSGYGRGLKRVNIWLIDGFAYARDAAGARLAFEPTTGELAGYVRVNSFRSRTEVVFVECNSPECSSRPHTLYMF